MRPRVFPAEDHRTDGGSGRRVTASMRPRVFPAEDLRHGACSDAHRGGQASMRPRVFPAEDPSTSFARRAAGSCFNEAAGIPRGRRNHSVRRVFRERASMRPRVFPAEDDQRNQNPRGETNASMRPRVFPAEDSRCVRLVWSAASNCFNEAAGIPRGRHGAPKGGPRGECASMRPRVFPAEDTTIRAPRHRMRASFNEAAGIPRGRRSSACAGPGAGGWLQ